MQKWVLRAKSLGQKADKLPEQQSWHHKVEGLRAKAQPNLLTAAISVQKLLLSRDQLPKARQSSLSFQEPGAFSSKPPYVRPKGLNLPFIEAETAEQGCLKQAARLTLQVVDVWKRYPEEKLLVRALKDAVYWLSAPDEGLSERVKKWSQDGWGEATKVEGLLLDQELRGVLREPVQD